MIYMPTPAGRHGDRDSPPGEVFHAFRSETGSPGGDCGIRQTVRRFLDRRERGG